MAMRKKGMPEVLARSVISLYEGAKARVRVDWSYQRNLRLKLECNKNLCCHLFLAVVVDVVTEFAIEDALSVLLYVDDLVLMSETIMGLRNMFLK